jgi:hypothetical protein
MSLPVSEQRALDRIACGLRASEPRLASMFAMFSKLSKDDRPPLQEQLSPGRLRWARLTTRLRHPARHRGPGRAQARHRRLRLLICSHIAAAAVLLGVLIVVLNSAHAGCGVTSGFGAGLMPDRAMSCQQHPGHVNDRLRPR